MKILLTVLALVPLFVFAAPPALSVEGTWKISAMNTAKGPVDAKLIEATPTLWEIRKGGTYTVTMTRGEKKKTIEGGWVLKGDQITVSEKLIDGKTPTAAHKDETMTAKREGKSLTLADDKGRSMVLTLQK